MSRTRRSTCARPRLIPLPTSNKGLSILSEAILAIGVVGIAIMFSLVAGNIIGFQGQGVFGTTQRDIAGDIGTRVETIATYNGTTAITYSPDTPQYSLRITEQSRIAVQLPNQEVQSIRFQNARLTNTRIEDADTLCIRKQQQEVSITAGNCSGVELGSFCEDGRCINGVCQPDKGETPGNAAADCSCPGDDPDASDRANTTWKPSYSPISEINALSGYDPTTDWGCVTDGYTWRQAKGERCEQDFECNKGLSCSDPHPTADAGVTGKRCCPAGESWDGSSCKDDDRLDMVFIPVNYPSSDAAAFEGEADTYYNKFLDYSPFQTCSSPTDRVNKHIVDISTGGACDFSCNNCAPGTLAANVEACGNQEYPEAEVYMGVCQGNSCCTDCLSGGGAYCGFYTSAYDITVTQAAPSCGWQTAIHEVGHQWGLAHVNGELTTEVGACNPDPADDCHGENDGAPNDPDCDDDVDAKEHYFLSYCENSLIDTYGPAATDHLTNTALDDFLEGCS